VKRTSTRDAGAPHETFLGPRANDRAGAPSGAMFKGRLELTGTSARSSMAPDGGVVLGGCESGKDLKVHPVRRGAEDLRGFVAPISRGAFGKTKDERLPLPGHELRCSDGKKACYLAAPLVVPLIPNFSHALRRLAPGTGGKGFSMNQADVGSLGRRFASCTSGARARQKPPSKPPAPMPPGRRCRRRHELDEPKGSLTSLHRPRPRRAWRQGGAGGGICETESDGPEAVRHEDPRERPTQSGRLCGPTGLFLRRGQLRDQPYGRSA